MVEYICPDCFKNFGNSKSHWNRHINKKKTCQIIDNNLILTPPENAVIAPKLLLKQTEKEKNNHGNKIDYICEYCLGSFCKKFNLDRHMNICKEKKRIDNENNKILGEKKKYEEDKLLKIDEKLNLILKQNEELKKENKKLKKQIGIKKNKSTVNKKSSDVNINIVNNVNNVNNVTNTNNNVLNNNITNTNNQQNIVNFNNMNYNNVDKKLFILPLMNSRLIGKGIILKMIENIYINVNLPEYQNIIITDKNRGYVKIYNNGQWKTDNLKIINTVIDGIVEHSKTILEELNIRYINNIQATNRISTSKKYINLCDVEYLDELEDAQENEQADNKNEIKRCKDFREMIFKDTINLFHDNKNILLKPKNFNLMDL